MDRRNHPVKEKKYEKQEINGNYRVPLYVCVGFVWLWFYGRKRTGAACRGNADCHRGTGHIIGRRRIHRKSVSYTHLTLPTNSLV